MKYIMVIMMNNKQLKWVYAILAWMISIIVIAQFTTEKWVIYPIFIGGLVLLFIVPAYADYREEEKIGKEDEKEGCENNVKH